jgi:polar amino acid transport system ATP-binding protein
VHAGTPAQHSWSSAIKNDAHSKSRINLVKKNILEIENLSKTYGNSTVLKDISLKVNEGDTIVIIGPSGTGKSTLLRCVNL